MKIKLDLPVAVIGMGKSGTSAYNFLVASGISKDQISTYDTKEGVADFSDHNKLLETAWPKTLVVSPGFPLSTKWIQDFKKSRGTVTNEINLAMQVITSEKIIGVTGSLGKSTTVSLLGAGLESFCTNYFVGGNLGTPFCDYARRILEKIQTPAEWVVLELSSYHLENSFDLKLFCSGITYFSPNHLERYVDKNHYYSTKWNIFNLTQGNIFLNSSGGELSEYLNLHPNSNAKLVNSKCEKFKTFELSKNSLIGSHNIDNLALASDIAIYCNWPTSSIQEMKNFKGLPHRLENVGTHNGVLFINDSKATAIDSVLSAVKSTTDSYPNSTIHLLLGGKDKGLPWEELSQLKNSPHICFYFFGQCRELAQTKSHLEGFQFSSMTEALQAAHKNTSSGHIVLLSPGGTSLDEFESFEARGDVFKEFYRSL